MKKLIAIGSSLMLMFTLLSGLSHAMGKKESMKCPDCNLVAVAKPRPKGGEYRQMKHLCPSCGTAFKEGTSGTEKIHVCTQCGAEIAMCPVCAKKS